MTNFELYKCTYYQTEEVRSTRWSTGGERISTCYLGIFWDWMDADGDVEVYKMYSVFVDTPKRLLILFRRLP